MINQKISDAKITRFPYSGHKTQSDNNIVFCHSNDQSPKTQSNKDIDTDKLSYEKMFSSNDVDLEFEDFDTKPTNSYQVVSPGLSITSYDLDQTQKSSDIQLYGSVSYNQREIPQIVLAFRKRRPAQLRIMENFIKFFIPDSSPFQNKKIQIKSFVLIPLKDEEEDEIFSVFDDPLNFYGTISSTKLDNMNQLQQFLTLYKMRTGTFPKQRENLENEIIISIAMNFQAFFHNLVQFFYKIICFWKNLIILLLFFNARLIAASYYLAKDVVQSIHYSLIKAIQDLTRLGHDLHIDFGFIKISIVNKDLKYKYMKKSDMDRSQHWKTTYKEIWSKSTLNNLPNPNQVQENYEISMALKIMSLDLKIAEQTHYSKIKNQITSIKQMNYQKQ